MVRDMARVINTARVVDVVASIIMKACYELDENTIDALKAARDNEESPYGKDTLDILIENAEYAKKEQIACCHDTGTCVLLVEIGQEVCWEGEPLISQLNKGVAKGYEEGYLRKSMIGDPLNRVNTGDNTPAVIHTEIVPGDKVKITAMPKGGGSENMGAFTTLVPSQGAQGVKEYVLEVMKYAGGKPCPPVIIGVGVGGTMDQCAWIAKKSLLRPIGERNPNPFYAQLELEILEEVNKLGIGPLGMGGRATALDVHIEYFPCHITSLPVAINFQCHANRHASAQI
jgi:fumarate hydratase subunit alpha